MDVCFLALSSTEGTISCDPVGQAHGGRRDAQRNASCLCSALTEGSLFPDTKKARHQRDPSSPASKVGGGQLGPQGPMQCGHRAVETKSPGPAPGSAAEDPTSRVGWLAKPAVWDRLLLTTSP